MNDKELIEKALKQIVGNRVTYEIVNPHFNTEIDCFFCTILISEGMLFSDEIDTLHIAHIYLTPNNKMDCAIVMLKHTYEKFIKDFS